MGRANTARLGARKAASGQSVHNASGHLGDVTEAVDPNDEIALVVHVDEGRGLLCINIHAVTNNLFGVVGSSLLVGSLEESRHDDVRVGLE